MFETRLRLRVSRLCYISECWTRARKTWDKLEKKNYSLLKLCKSTRVTAQQQKVENLCKALIIAALPNEEGTWRLNGRTNCRPYDPHNVRFLFNTHFFWERYKKFCKVFRLFAGLAWFCSFSLPVKLKQASWTWAFNVRAVSCGDSWKLKVLEGWVPPYGDPQGLLCLLALSDKPMQLRSDPSSVRSGIFFLCVLLCLQRLCYKSSHKQDCAVRIRPDHSMLESAALCEERIFMETETEMCWMKPNS